MPSLNARGKLKLPMTTRFLWGPFEVGPEARARQRWVLFEIDHEGRACPLWVLFEIGHEGRVRQGFPIFNFL